MKGCRSLAALGTASMIAQLPFAGHYCCKTGHPEEATAHFVAASRTAKRRATKQVATWEAALCLIEDGGEGGLVRAIEMLKQEGIYDKPADSTGHIARYTSKRCSPWQIYWHPQSREGGGRGLLKQEGIHNKPVNRPHHKVHFQAIIPPAMKFAPPTAAGTAEVGVRWGDIETPKQEGICLLKAQVKLQDTLPNNITFGKESDLHPPKVRRGEELLKGIYFQPADNTEHAQGTIPSIPLPAVNGYSP